MIKYIGYFYYFGLIFFLILCISILEKFNIINFLGFSFSFGLPLRVHSLAVGTYFIIFTQVLKYLIATKEEILSEDEILKLKKIVFFNYIFIFVLFPIVILSTIFGW